MRLLLDVTFVCHPVRLRICGKCREMRRSEAEGRFGEAEPEGCASIRVSFVPYAVLFSTVCCTDPTVLPIRKAPLALMSVPLDNQEIAFGVVHFALCPFPRSCAQRWGRYSPRLHEAFPAFGSRAAPTFGCTSALRCIIRSPIRAVRLRMEYHPSPSITVSTAPYASSRSCALRSPVAHRLSPSRYRSRIPVSCCGASAPYSRAKRGMEQCQPFGLCLAQMKDGLAGLLMRNASLKDFYCSRFFHGAVKVNCQTLNGIALKGETLTGQ